MTSREPAIRQIAALPYRIEDDGSASVLLITSRETRRWVIPKGNRIKGIDPHHAAAIEAFEAFEAFEEAGIKGLLCQTSLGSFAYHKRRGNGTTRAAMVEVFSLAVTDESPTWPEQHQRLRQWFGLADAVAAVDEPGLKTIIGALHNPAR